MRQVSGFFGVSKSPINQQNEAQGQGASNHLDLASKEQERHGPSDLDMLATPENELMLEDSDDQQKKPLQLEPSMSCCESLMCQEQVDVGTVTNAIVNEIKHT